LSKKSEEITIPGFGKTTCGKLQNMADDNVLFPDECGQIQIKTLATSDPCGCKDFDGSDCETPGFSNTQSCNLCGGNKIIGDPDRVIDTGILQGATCIDVFDDNRFGAFVSVCSTAQNLVQKFCRCVNLGTAVKQCIPLEERYCDRNDDSDVCCAGSCKYLRSKQGYRCTERPGDTPPTNNAPKPKPNKKKKCFPGDVQVVVKDKGEVALRNLKIGDYVETELGHYEPIYSFGHKSDTIMVEYLKIRTDKIASPILISPDHMIFIPGNHAVPVGTLQKGDSLLLPNGESTVITNIQTVERQGMFAPFTMSGKLLVNGYVASSFVSIQPPSGYLVLGNGSWKTPISLQWLAHVFESPHRLVYRLGITTEFYSREGISQWVERPLYCFEWLVHQNTTIMLIIMIPMFVIFGTIWIFEQHLLVSAALTLVILFQMLRVSSKQKHL
jgi:Hint module